MIEAADGMRTLVALFALTLFLVACGGGNGAAPTPAVCRDPTVVVPTGEIPTAAPGSMIPRRCGDDGPATVPLPTETPEAALPPDQALAQLLETPGVAAAVRAAIDGDVDGLLDLVDWQPFPCGGKEGSDACPQGVAPGTQLPSVDMDGGITFWAREKTARAAMKDLLAAPVALTFASRDGSRYYVGLQGEPRPLGESVLWGDAASGTGVFLVIDSAAEHPVSAVHPLAGDGRAAAHAEYLGYTAYEIIAYAP